MTDFKTPTQGHGLYLRMQIHCIGRAHFIMNLWDASFPCSRHACPGSYSGSYLNNWFQNLQSQSCKFHAYQQVEERFFSTACSMQGSRECMFYEVGKHEKTTDYQLRNFPLGSRKRHVSHWICWKTCHWNFLWPWFTHLLYMSCVTICFLLVSVAYCYSGVCSY